MDFKKLFQEAEENEMAFQTKNVFINLPVKDLQKSKQFFSEIGFEYDEQMTDDKGACMIIGENMYVMLLAEPFFKTFVKKELTDTAQSTEVIIAFSADSREEVDEVVNKALQAGGSLSNDKMDDEYMYGWSFQDIDGHLWEVIYMAEEVE